MKKITFEEIPDVVINLGKKIEYLENIIKQKDCFCKVKNRLQNHLMKDRCCSNFNKSDLAQFFYILMDENILFFDNNSEKYNRSKMQQFIEDNFTYKGDAGSQTIIGKVSKQFSESKGFTYKEKQLKFLDEIIGMLQRRREKVAGR